MVKAAKIVIWPMMTALSLEGRGTMWGELRVFNRPGCLFLASSQADIESLQAHTQLF
jgi:hypothetical protein